MYLTSHFLQHKHRNAWSERSPNHRKANYDLDQFTEENSKNPSLNSTLGCLKVVDTFRPATLVAGGQGSHHRGDAGAWREGVRGCSASRDFGEPGVHLAPAIASEP